MRLPSTQTLQLQLVHQYVTTVDRDLWSVNLQGCRLFMAKNPGLLYCMSFISYILHSEWSLLSLVNIHGSFHCKKDVIIKKVVSIIMGKKCPPVTTETSVSGEYIHLSALYCRVWLVRLVYNYKQQNTVKCSSYVRIINHTIIDSVTLYVVKCTKYKKYIRSAVYSLDFCSFQRVNSFTAKATP